MLVYMALDSVGILREVQKLFSRNAKLMCSIMLLLIYVNSTLMASFIICIKVPVNDLSFKATFLQVNNNSTSAEFTNLLVTMKDDIRLFSGLELFFFCAFSFTSLFFITASIIGSAAVRYSRKDLSTNDLLSRAGKSLKRPFVTWFYIKLLDLGYCLFIALLLLSLLLIFNFTFTIMAFSIVILILAVFFRTYLSVIWCLALVVSVLEEKCGIEALGKAGRLIKGSKLRGFFLNLVGTLSMYILYGLGMIGTAAFPANARMVPFLFSYSVICLSSMGLLMSYTVLYYEFKETLGEELERKGSMEYTKPTSSEFTPLSTDAP